MAITTLAATFHLTHHCNLRCTYCYTGEKRPIAMSRATADKAIAFVLAEAALQQAARLDITFFGGEPLLEADNILYIADRFRADAPEALAVYFKLSTNGTLLTKPLLAQLLDRRIYISLSIDGPPDIHDHNRPQAGGQPSSRGATTAAKLLLRVNPATSVTCVVTPHAAGQVAVAVDYLYTLGFRYILTTLDYAADWTAADFKHLKAGYLALADWYETKILANETFYLSFFDERVRTRTYKPLAAHERCHIGGRQFSIAPDGTLYPCVQFVTTEGLPQYIIGHIDHGFDAHCRTHYATASEREKPECAGCALEIRCSKWCSCINFMSTGSVEKASPIVCYNEKILIEIVDKTADRLWKRRSPQFLHKHYNPDYPLFSHLELHAEHADDV